MWPDWVLNPGLLALESDALQTALCGLAMAIGKDIRAKSVQSKTF